MSLLKRSFVRFAAGGACLLVAACSSGDSNDARSNEGAANGTPAPDAGHGGQPGVDAGSDHRAPNAAPEGGATKDAPEATALGKACKADADCGHQGLTCLTTAGQGLFGGGPANGYCTLDCSAAAAADAGGDDPCVAHGGHCLNYPEDEGHPATAWCALDCELGQNNINTTGAQKCQGRLDSACAEGMPGAAYGLCQPLCGSDDDCAGRKCDPRLGVCIDQTRQGDPTGEHCSGDPNSAPTCAGTCVTVGTVGKICSSPCVQGNPEACRTAGSVDSMGRANAICGLSATDNPGVGDLGFCSQLCDTDSDCLDQEDPGIYCDKRSIKQLGRGYCFWGAPDGGASGGDAGAPNPGDAGTGGDGAGS